MPIKISSAGIHAIKVEEGVRLQAYLDTVGVPTIGYGHTKNVKMGQRITQAQAEAFLIEDINEVENALNKSLKVEVTQDQYDAMIVLGFNVGANGLATSTLVKKLNAGDVTGAALEFARWNKVTDPITKKKIPDPTGVLSARRAREMTLFLSGKIEETAKLAVKTVKKNPAITALLIVGGAYMLTKMIPGMVVGTGLRTLKS